MRQLAARLLGLVVTGGVAVGALAPVASASTSAVPVSYTPYTLVQNFGAYGNAGAGLGDCQSAATGDLAQLWNAEAGLPSAEVPQSQITSMFRFVNPLLTNANWFGSLFTFWNHNSVGGIHVKSWHAINGIAPYSLAYTAAQIVRIKRAIIQYGGIYGAAMVPSVDGAVVGPWTVANSSSADGTFGHAFAIVGYSPGYLDIVTWGQVQQVTWQWWENYGTNIYVVAH